MAARFSLMLRMACSSLFCRSVSACRPVQRGARVSFWVSISSLMSVVILASITVCNCSTGGGGGGEGVGGGVATRASIFLVRASSCD